MPSKPPPASPSPPARALMSAVSVLANTFPWAASLTGSFPRGVLCRALPALSLPVLWLCLAVGLYPCCPSEANPRPSVCARGQMFRC